MSSNRIITVEKIITYQKETTSEMFSIKLDGLEIVLLSREKSKELSDLLDRALDNRKELIHKR